MAMQKPVLSPSLYRDSALTQLRSWAAGEVTKILGFEDDVVLGLLFDLLEGPRHVCPYLKTFRTRSNRTC